MNIPDPNDSWAEVELFRWQYGELPKSNDTRKLDVSAGIKGMAKAFEEGTILGSDLNKMPTPMNLISVLKYLSKFDYKEE